MLSVALIAVGLVVFTSLPSSRPVTGNNPIQHVSFKSPSAAAAPETFNDLLGLSPDELAEIDIARVNLLCATGLPGAEDLTPETIETMLARIDAWAERVRLETERHHHWLIDPRHADKAKHFGNSEARFRAEFLVDVLQNDIGIQYHEGFVPADEDVPPFKTSKETFLHGLLDHEDPKQAFGGNCVSLPVIYAAVGRRLGYPIKLVTSKEHVFCRWMGEDHPNKAWRDTFNFDGAGKGYSIDPDAFYMTWPRESNEAEVEIFDWFKPLTPSQEMALFMLARGHVQRMVGKNLNAAQTSYTFAANLWPTNRNPLLFISSNASMMWEREYADHPDIRPRQATPPPTEQAQAMIAAQEDDNRPWWETEAGRAENDAFVRRINEVNRLNTLARQKHNMPGVQTPGGFHMAWPGHPQPTTPPAMTHGFPQPLSTPQPRYGFPGEPQH